jgi:predicted dehydrogenase
MNVGVAGVGVMGRNHLRVYSEIRGVSEVHAFDVSENATRRLSDPEIIVSHSLEELLARVDAVSICVPTASHFDVAMRAIDAGLDCLIEKPMTVSAQQGAQLIDHISKADGDLVVGVGFVERFNPIVNEIAQLSDQPHLIEFKRHNPASSRVADSSVVHDLMIHDIDILFNVFLKERPYRLCSVGNPDVCKALVAANGTYAELSASRKACKKVRSMYVEMQDCTVEGDFMTQEVFIYRKGGRFGLDGGRYAQENVIEKVLVNKVEPLKVELKTFLDCVRKREPFPASPLEALRNLKICEDIGSKIA